MADNVVVEVVEDNGWLLVMAALLMIGCPNALVAVMEYDRIRRQDVQRGEGRDTLIVVHVGRSISLSFLPLQQRY